MPIPSSIPCQAIFPVQPAFGVQRPHLNVDQLRQPVQQPPVVMIGRVNPADQMNCARSASGRTSARASTHATDDRAQYQVREYRERLFAQAFRSLPSANEFRILHQFQVPDDGRMRTAHRHRLAYQALGLVQVVASKLDHAQHVQGIMRIRSALEHRVVVTRCFVHPRRQLMR